MLYMFSGPDYLYANVFFPEATTYVLSGLEPVGRIPDMSRVRRGSLSSTLAHIRSSLGSVMNYSFFKTRDMRAQLRGGEFTGTLPLLYVFLARAGKTINDVSLVTLDKEGVEQTAGETLARGAPTGVKIAFAGSDGKPRTLYYFSTDLSDGGVADSGFLKFCERLGDADSLIKSASYLLHSGNFTTVRNFLLNNSATIIQDDSGIPLTYYSTKKWRLFPFGRYLGPIDEFPGRYQESYAVLFRRAQPIDFGIGYRWRTPETNVLLAVRLPDDGSPAIDATASAEEPAPPPRPRKPRPPAYIGSRPLPDWWPQRGDGFFFWR